MTAPVQIAKLQADLAAFTTDAAGVTLPALPELTAQVNALQPDPLPTTQPQDAVTIYDGPRNTTGSPPGGVSRKFLYQTWLPWRNVGGDWVDAAGTLQGTVPFFQLSPTTGQTGKIQADVTALVKQDARMLLRGVGQETCVFYSRESDAGPVIIYDTPTGQVVSPCVADAECNPSTDYEMGNNPSFTVTVANGVYLSFPDPPQGWAKATLELTISKEWTGGKINGYRFQWGGLPTMNNPTETLSLKGDPRVFFETADFTDIPSWLAHQIFGDPAHSMGMDIYKQKAIVDVDDGTKALQLTFDPHINGCLAATIPFPNGDEADEAAVEFDMRFMPDMLTGLTQGFKCFAGFRSATKPDDAYFCAINPGTQVGRFGTLLAGNGGAKSHGNDGWSTRFDMFMSPGPDHPLYGHFAPMQYIYWPEQSDFYGDAHLWNGAGFTARAGEWHRYTTRLRVNTCVGTAFQKDAALAMWIDGVLAHRWDNFYLRNTDDPLIMHAPYNVQEGKTYDVRSKLRIASVWLNSYHGGLALPRARCSYQVRNLRVAKFA